MSKAAGLPLGEEAGYFTGGTGLHGQDEDDSILEYNTPPSGQPGLWCEWTPNEEGAAIVWSGAEKFYCYVEWLQYLMHHFLTPWGYVVNGEAHWIGEDDLDRGTITVSNNQVTAEPEG